VPEPQASLLTGILLGDDSGLSEPMQDAFRTTGMTHIIAISGFNIALLAGVLLRAGRPLLGYRAAAWAALTGVALYALFVGAEASVVRAAIMGGLYVIATRLLGRPTFAPAALVTAAVLMTIAQPLALWDVGFQLSFAATLGLMLYTAPMGKWSQAQFEHRFSRPNAIRITGFLSEVVLATIAAQLLVLPLLAYHFGQFSLVSLPANLLILPAQPAVMTWGGLTTLLGLIAAPLAQPLAWVAWLFLAYTTSMVQLLAQVPAAAFPVRLDLSGLIALYALILGITWWTRQEAESRDAVRSRWVGRVRPVAVLSAVAITTLLAWQWARSQPDGRLHVTFFDVGQGDAILIETPRGRQILVDGGHEPSLLNEHLGRTLPFWDRSLDLVVATHPDADHVAGLPGVLERYRVDLLLTDGTPLGFSATYDALLIAADRAGTPIDAADAGQTVSLDEELTLVVLHPDRGQSFEDNDRSVSLRLTYGEFTLLLTGDAEERAERTMVDSGRELRSLIFKAGHHGARTSSNDFFLASVQPQVVVVSAGADNRFGHPHEESLQRAAAVGATVLRTDELGTIEVVTDGEQMWWEASK
jgi:competence protein ComEC